MKWQRAIAGLVLLCAAALLIPAGAGAVDSDLKHAFAFKVEGSNGYSVIAAALNERADGRGEIVLFVTRKGESAIYSAPALLTATSLKANLGALGKVSLDVAPSGREKKLRPRPGCGEGRATFYEPVRFSGNFEFHGEEGYTEAASMAPTEFTRFFHAPICSVGGGGEVTGGHLPGARLRLRSFGGAPASNCRRTRTGPTSARVSKSTYAKSAEQSRSPGTPRSGWARPPSSTTRCWRRRRCNRRLRSPGAPTSTAASLRKTAGAATSPSIFPAARTCR